MLPSWYCHYTQWRPANTEIHTMLCDSRSSHCHSSSSSDSKHSSLPELSKNCQPGLARCTRTPAMSALLAFHTTARPTTSRTIQELLLFKTHPIPTLKVLLRPKDAGRRARVKQVPSCPLEHLVNKRKPHTKKVCLMS
jgi:hypothetical protein